MNFVSVAYILKKSITSSGYFFQNPKNQQILRFRGLRISFHDFLKMHFLFNFLRYAALNGCISINSKTLRCKCKNQEIEEHDEFK